MTEGRGTSGWSPAVGTALGVLALVLCGQLLLIIAGTVAPDLLRFSGYGPKITPDTPGYLRVAASLPGIPSEWWGKILYVVLLRAGLATGSAPWFIVVLQTLTAGFAGWVFVDLGRRLGSSRAGWIAAAIWLVNPQTAQWTTVVMTDSLFMSLLALLLYACVRALDGSGTWTAAVTLSGLVAMLRPNGILAVASVGLLWLWSPALHRGRAPASRTARISGSAATLLVVLLVLGLSPAHRSGTGGPQDHPLERLVAGEVVWGEPEWSRPMPPAPDEERSLAALARYAIDAPLKSADVALRRIVVEIVQVRPHYPAIVNVLVGASMLLYLGAAAIGAMTPAGRRLLRPVLILTVPMLGTVGATWASPEGRFGWAFLVLLGPWVGLGLDRVASRLSRRRAPRSARR